MCEAIPSLPQYAFMAQCSVKDAQGQPNLFFTFVVGLSLLADLKMLYQLQRLYNIDSEDNCEHLIGKDVEVREEYFEVLSWHFLSGIEKNSN
jgi:hypothetical protein